jgi:uncharacterized protein YndB with AHSA1/START domain
MTHHEQVVEVETRIDAPPDVVFEYFTDAKKYIRWMGVGADLDPRPDGEFTLSAPGGHTAAGRYLTVDPPRRLTFTWGWEGSPDVPPGSSTVEVTLVPDGDGTIVRLRHSGLPNDQQREMHGQGWRRYLSRLSVAGGGGDPGPDDPSS